MHPRSVSAEQVMELVEDALGGEGVPLMRTVGFVFSNVDALRDSFLPQPGVSFTTRCIRVCPVLHVVACVAWGAVHGVAWGSM